MTNFLINQLGGCVVISLIGQQASRRQSEAMEGSAPQPTDDMEKPFKILMVGDGMVGRTSLCKSYTDETFSNVTDATIWQCYTKKRTLPDGNVRFVEIVRYKLMFRKHNLTFGTQLDRMNLTIFGSEY